jgi:hypothetical protein
MWVPGEVDVRPRRQQRKFLFRRGLREVPLIPSVIRTKIGWVWEYLAAFAEPRSAG